MHETDEEGEGRTAPFFLSARSINKHFGGVRALKGVDIDIKPGEVHGLVGANGAGKSTLIRVLAGLETPDDGVITLDGRDVTIDNAQAATRLGLSFIHQELALVPNMTVLENIMLGSKKKSRFGWLDWSAIEADVQAVADRVGLDCPLSINTSKLTTAENWLVSICRALVHRSRLIVMDEPTASLAAKEAEQLFAIVRSLAAEGVAVLYVSHRLDEILELCHRVTVFRDGNSIGTIERSELDRDVLVTGIVGAEVVKYDAPALEPVEDDVVFSVRGLGRLPRVKSVSFDLHRGEVLGLGGLVGSGRSELARLLFGADRAEKGEMTMLGARYAPASPGDAVKAGIGFVPEERRADGLILSKGLAFNISLANLDKIRPVASLPFYSPKSQAKLAQSMIQALQIKAQGLNAPVGRLSGGNQQKVVIGRWLAREPEILILDEPTRGVDVGARGEIHRLIRDLAKKGLSVIVISSEPDELPDLCNRVLVMAEGEIVGELRGGEISRSAIVEASYAIAS